VDGSSGQEQVGNIISSQEKSVSLRLEYWSAAPEEYRALLSALAKLKAGLEARLWDLVFVRVSQINGCSFCVDTHATEALNAGESPRRLNALAVWRDAPLFTEQERAALAWAERLTRVSDPGSFDETYGSLRPHFPDKEIAVLTFAISLMNSLNRVAIGFGRTPAVEAAS
jgi:AhpD family alkylhydroperoxidase